MNFLYVIIMSHIYIQKSSLTYINFDKKHPWLNITLYPIPSKILKNIKYFENLKNNDEICLNILMHGPSKKIFIKNINHSKYFYSCSKYTILINDEADEFIKDFNRVVKCINCNDFLYFVCKIKNHPTKLNNVFQLFEMTMYICDFL